MEIILITTPLLFCLNRRGKPGILPGLGYVILYSGFLFTSVIFEFIPDYLYKQVLGITLLISITAILITVFIINKTNDIMFVRLEHEFKEKLAAVMSASAPPADAADAPNGSEADALYGTNAVAVEDGADNMPGGAGQTQDGPGFNAPGNIFTEDERDVAKLLIEGKSGRDIARKLHLDVQKASVLIQSVHEKVLGHDNIDVDEANISAIVKKFNLTGREKDMLCCLRQGMSNAQIASTLFLTESTIKTHIHNLMKKIPPEDRKEVPVWMDTFG
jgi:DNA-binding NarL/FixJ family response regulator